MDDPNNGWLWLASHFDEERGRTVFYEDEEEIPEDTANVREAYFAVAYDCDDKDRDLPVDVWELRKSLVAALITEYEADYETITDRNYRIRRRGTGLDTTYSATPAKEGETPFTKKMKRARDEADGLIMDTLDQLLANQ